MKDKLLGKLNILAFVGIIVAAVLLYMILVRRNEEIEQKEQSRTSNICMNELPGKIEDRYLDEFFGKKTSEKEAAVSVKLKDLERLTKETYDCFQVSMWDDTVCSEDWYEFYFAENMINAEYNIHSCEELCEYITTAFNTKNDIKKVFMCVDPEQFHEEYYKSISFDAEPRAFEEYLSEELFSIFSEHEETEFVFILPIKSIFEYATISESERQSRFDDWYTFLMYLRWNTNARAEFAGGEEWLVTRADFFEADGTLTEECQKYIYLREYYTDEYTVTPPELESKCKAVERYIKSYSNGDYDWSKAADKKVVFIGDGVFWEGNLKGLDITSYFAQQSGAECLVIDSIGACVAETYDKNLISDIPNRIETEVAKFAGADSAGSDLVFVISAGKYDYILGTPLKTSKKVSEDASFEGAYAKILDSIMTAYPDCRIITMTPTITEQGQYGTKKMTKTGAVLSDYVKSIKKLSKDRKLSCIDMNKISGIDKSNVKKLVKDDIFLAVEKYVFYAKQIYNEIVREE